MQLKNPILGLCQQSTFMLSAAKVDQCPDDEGFEVAFAGRSNAGKSSALNTLTHASLARTSKTPGRTQLLNFFKLDDDRRLVDLPGYGYAKVPIPLKLHWQRHLEAYLGGRESLKGLILMMDIRHPMTDFDLLMLDWAVASGMPMHILLTKADKLTYGAAKNVLLKVQSDIRKGWGCDHHSTVFGAKTSGPGRRLHCTGGLDGAGGQGRGARRAVNRRQKKPRTSYGEGEVPGSKFRTARAGSRYLPTLNTT